METKKEFKDPRLTEMLKHFKAHLNKMSEEEFMEAFPSMFKEVPDNINQDYVKEQFFDLINNFVLPEDKIDPILKVNQTLYSDDPLMLERGFGNHYIQIEEVLGDGTSGFARSNGNGVFYVKYSEENNAFICCYAHRKNDLNGYELEPTDIVAKDYVFKNMNQDYCFLIYPSTMRTTKVLADDCLRAFDNLIKGYNIQKLD